MIDRRTFLAGMGAVILAAPLAVEAQQTGKVWRIGWLGNTPPTNQAVAANLEAFRQRLQELGYVEGRNVVLERRYAEGQDARFPELAAELVRLKVDVIVSGTGPGTVAAKEATSTIPIVIAAVSDPVGRGWVTSFARPGGNITGVADRQTDLLSKRIELLKAAIPKAARVLSVSNAAGWEPATLAVMRKDLDIAAQAIGVTLLRVDMNSPSDLDSVAVAIVRGRPDAMLIGPVPITFQFREELAELAVKHRLPAMAATRANAVAGSLISYGPAFPDMFRRAADYVDKILKGVKPSDLPIDQPSKFELVINLKTAKALGLTIPPSLLGRADEVIQ